jgi:hypothetical protein
LWRDSCHLSEKIVNEKKTDFGVSISAFRDFFVKDNKVYSIVEVTRLKGTEAFALLKQFFEDNLINENKYREILVMMSCVVDLKPVSHSGTFFCQETSDGKVYLKYYDPYENHLFEKGGHKIDYKKLFSRFELITVHAL